MLSTIVSKNRIRIISVIAFACMLGVISTAKGMEPLIPHVIKDMILVGQEGTSNSWDVRDMTLVGNYLYCSGGPGLQTLDISDPTNLQLVDDWNVGNTKMNGSAAKGNILYVAHWSPGIGLRVFSISNPAHPSLIKTLSTTAHTWDVQIFGDLLFVTISNGLDPPDGGIAGINIYDITNASDPVLLSFIDAGMRLVGNAVQYGNYLYFTSKKWLNVYNISNPSSPQFIRRLAFAAMAGQCAIRGDYLYMTASDFDSFGYQGGLYTFSLTDPSNPQLADWLDEDDMGNIHFQEDLCFITSTSRSMFTVDMSDPTNLEVLDHWIVTWPNTGHGGYTLCSNGSGTYVFVGVATAVTETCSNFDCPYFGARVYSVEAFSLIPPIIAEVTPDPDSVYIGQGYTRQLTLTQGNPAETNWSVLQGPDGTQVDSNGLVNGWTPASADVGSLFTFNIKATNIDGQDTEQWQVRVKSRADFDGDYDVDQEDFGWFQTCYSGPGVFPTTECEPADFDTDRDVDIDDFTVFNNCLGNPNNPPGC